MIRIFGLIISTYCIFSVVPLGSQPCVECGVIDTIPARFKDSVVNALVKKEFDTIRMQIKPRISILNYQRDSLTKAINRLEK